MNVIINRYSKDEQLQKPEKTILEIFRNDLKKMKVLDIGVGGGRTTASLSKLVKEYNAIDYSEDMIAACKKRFPDLQDKFNVSDVRNMSLFPSETFDFILFSFNGLDYISPEDRLIALSEIKRVLKKDGIFVFSSHNLQSDYLYNIKFSLNPIKLIENISKYLYVLLFNNNLHEKRKGPFTLLKDGGHFFKLTNYYIRPQAQISQLKESGFSNIKLYSFYSGKEITSEIEKVNDPWIYYSCVS